MNLLLREEKASDLDAIRKVHQSAFDSPDEAGLVDLLRSRGKAIISFAAEEKGEILGHIVFSPVSIDPPSSGWNALGLAPVAVRPERQRQGIGKSLVREGIERCKTIGSSVVVVLGDPAYYTQFGFSSAADFSLNNEYMAGDAFMVIEFLPGVLENTAGTVKYAPKFGEIAL